MTLADRHGAHLEGVTGERIGVIGALAAVGLRRGGHDGRFIWLEGVRELQGSLDGRHTAGDDWHRLRGIDRRAARCRPTPWSAWIRGRARCCCTAARCC